MLVANSIAKWRQMLRAKGAAVGPSFSSAEAPVCVRVVEKGG